MPGKHTLTLAQWMEIEKLLEKEFRCDHPSKQLVYIQRRRNTRTHYEQCTRCGCCIRVRQLNRYRDHPASAAVPWSPAIAAAYQEHGRARREHLIALAEQGLPLLPAPAP